MNNSTTHAWHRFFKKVALHKKMLETSPDLLFSSQDRMKALDEQKGYPKDWIDKRLRSMAIRQNLTDEWQDRGIENQRDYAILTAEISKAIFGMCRENKLLMFTKSKCVL